MPQALSGGGHRDNREFAMRIEKYGSTTVYCGIYFVKILDVGCFPLTGLPLLYKTIPTKGLSKREIDPLN
jgi:hypothetical protein